ncbi:site-specific integrase [Actinoplanes oblitus]|uniref:site-specific integrase n=1 Tax=Actinoplanes oblitus TaxID=3040509 RepID=UPI002E1FFD55
MRRGELGSLTRAAVDLDRGLLFVERQRTTAGYTVVEGEPKTAAGRRAVALDKHTVAVLRTHRSRQLAHRDKRHDNNQVCVNSGYLFTRKDGEPINPSYATTRFCELTTRAGLPPVRLHDLRHGAASLAHEAGADLKTLQDPLGHSSIVVPPTPTPACCPIRSAAAPTRQQPWSSPRHGTPGSGSSTKRRRTVPRAATKNKPPQRISRTRRTTIPGHGSASTCAVTEGDDTQVPPTRHPTSTKAGQRERPGPRFRSPGPFLKVRPKGLEPLTF